MIEHASAAVQAAPEGVPIPRLTVRAIAAIVAEDYGVPMSLLAAAVRTKAAVEPRHVAMWLAHRHSGMSLPQIGRVLGGRDHTTVLHGSRAVEERRRRDCPFAARLTRLVGLVNAAELGLLRAAPAPQEPVGASGPVAPIVVEIERASPAERRVLTRLAAYLKARDAEVAATHTRGEAGARRMAEDAYRALREAHAAMPFRSDDGSAAA